MSQVDPSPPPTAPQPRRRVWIRRIGITLLVFFVLVGVRVAWIGILLARGGKPPKLARETTYVTGPLRSDGAIDYLASLNAKMSEGVTPENNAARPLMQVLAYLQCDAAMDQESARRAKNEGCDRLLTALGVPPLPPEDRLRSIYLFLDADQRRRADEQKPGEWNCWDEESAAQNAPWTAAVLPIAYRSIQANEAALDRVVAASRLSRYHIPRYTTTSDGMLIAMLLPDVQHMRDAARRLVSRGMLRLAEGKPAAASEDFLACHRLGRLMAQEPTIICWMVGTIMDQIAMSGDSALAHYGNLSRQQLADYRRRLAELPPMPTLQSKLPGERMMALDGATAVLMGRADFSSISDGDSAQGSVFMRLFDANESLQVVNAAYDDLEKAWTLPTFAERKEASSQVVRDWQTRTSATRTAGHLFRRATLGSQAQASRDLALLIVSLFIPASDACIAHDAQHHYRQMLRDVTLELAQYRAAHGGYPPSLDDLKSLAIATAPSDLLVDAPLTYQRTEKGYVLRAPYVFHPANIENDGVKVEMPIPPLPKREL